MAENRLAKEFAEQFLPYADSVDLSDFTQFNDDIAECLSKYRGKFELNGLTSLSEAAVEKRSKYDGTHDLALGQLPESVVEILRQHPNFQNG